MTVPGLLNSHCRAAMPAGLSKVAFVLVALKKVPPFCASTL